MLSSPTRDSGKLLASLVDIQIGAMCDIVSAIHVAQVFHALRSRARVYTYLRRSNSYNLHCDQLALKHRQNQAGQARIICIVGSPVKSDERALTKVGKMLKKENVGDYFSNSLALLLL